MYVLYSIHRFSFVSVQKEEKWIDVKYLLTRTSMEWEMLGQRGKARDIWLLDSKRI